MNPVDAIEHQTKLKEELAALFLQASTQHLKVDRLRPKSLDLQNAVNGLLVPQRNTGYVSAGREGHLKAKQAELETAKAELLREQNALAELDSQIKTLQQTLSGLSITVSADQITAHQALMTDAQAHVDLLNDMLSKHRQTAESYKVLSKTALPLIDKKNQLLIDANFGADNAQGLAQLNTEIEEALTHDAAINSQNQTLLAEKTRFIDAVYVRLETANLKLTRLQEQHKQLLAVHLKTLASEQETAYQQAAVNLLIELKKAKALDAVIAQIGFSDTVASLCGEMTIVNFERLRLVPENQATTTIEDEAQRLKEGFALQGIRFTS